MDTCRHDGFHSGQGRYDPRSGRLRYVLVCDACHRELGEVETVEYRPAFDPHGNDPHPKAA